MSAKSALPTIKLRSLQYLKVARNCRFERYVNRSAFESKAAILNDNQHRLFLPLSGYRQHRDRLYSRFEVCDLLMDPRQFANRLSSEHD